MDRLLDIVGKPFDIFDKDGNYINCLYPIYVLYPNLPRYKMPKGNGYRWALCKFNELFNQVNDIQKGDIIVFKNMDRMMHIGIFIGNDKIVHCGVEVVEIIRLKSVKKLIQGIYRYEV